MPPIITTTSCFAMQKTTSVAFSRELSHSRFDNGFTRNVIVGEGMTCFIQPFINRQREVQRIVRPSMNTVPTAAELLSWLGWIFSGTQTGTGGSGDPYIFRCTDSAVNLRDFHYKKSPTDTVETVSSCAATSVVFSADSTNQFLALSAEGLGVSYNPAGTWPGGTTPMEQVTSPFVLPDTAGAVLLGGTPLRVAGVAVSLNFMYDGERFLNSLELTDFAKMDAVHTVALTFPLGERLSAYTFNPADETLSITFTNGTRVFALTFPKINFPENPIEFGLRTEVALTLTGRAFRTSTVYDDTVQASLIIP
jgi:hypothetical protein